MDVQPSVPVSDDALADELYRSFSRQCAWYDELTSVAQSALGKLAISRGDVTPIAGHLARKQQLLDAIVRERDRVHGLAEAWCERKQRAAVSDPVRKLDEMLARIQTAIGAFLSHEENLQTALRRTSGAGGGETA